MYSNFVMPAHGGNLRLHCFIAFAQAFAQPVKDSETHEGLGPELT